VLTRDRELPRGCYVHALKPSQRFKEILVRLDLVGRLRLFTLCLECNRPLRDVAKAQVLDRLPPMVRERYARFTTCDACGRIYWEGSHWQRMRELVDDATACKG
jgi:uncharacterized protein with PIN domain